MKMSFCCARVSTPAARARERGRGRSGCSADFTVGGPLRSAAGLFRHTSPPAPPPRAGHEKVLKQCSCVGSSLIYTSDTDRVISQQQSHRHRRMLHHVSGYLVVALLTSIARSSPCSAWKTLKQHNCSFCDAPGSGSAWARNLTTLLGPQCGPTVLPESCCWQPIGYAHGPAYGTPCSEVCMSLEDGAREGADEAFCSASGGAHYGNCFCGPFNDKPSSPRLKWAFKTNGAVYSSPIVSPDGATLFVGSLDNHLYAIDAASGTQKWAFATDDHIHSSPALSSDGKTVFIGSDDHKLYAIDTTNGKLRWSLGTGGSVYSTPTLSPDGKIVYVGSDDGHLYAVDAASGTLRWSYAAADWVDSSPTLAPDGKTVFVGSDDHHLYAISVGSTGSGVRAMSELSNT